MVWRNTRDGLSRDLRGDLLVNLKRVGFPFSLLMLEGSA
jgi:hypothetical protein